MLEVNLFLDEDDLYQGKRTDEYVMRYLMHHGIMGASVFSATMGYGQKHHLHHRRGIGVVDEGPIMILFIDAESKVRNVLPHLKEVVKDGLITAKQVERVLREPPSCGGGDSLWAQEGSCLAQSSARRDVLEWRSGSTGSWKAFPREEMPSRR